jgi:hypothetical protein
MPYNPSEKEEEYIKRQEMEKLKRLAADHAENMEGKERDQLKEMHWMHCPKCGLELKEVEFRGVLVDACFTCGGMFFDKGEVEKLAEDPDSGLLGRMTSVLFGKK